MKLNEELYQKIKKYLDNNAIERLLHQRFYNNLYETYLIQSDELKMAINLDEYFYILMSEKKSMSSNPSLNKYLSIIQKQLQVEPLLLLELPMNKLDKNILKYYLPNYDYILKNIEKIEIEANNIYRKFILSNYNISNQELSKLVKFFSYNLPNNYIKMHKAMEQIAKFILNNQKDTQYNYIYSEFLIKFFGYKKIYENKLYDTKILLAKLDETTYGESTENYAILNKELLQHTTMENNNLEDKFQKKIKKEQTIDGEKYYKVVEILAIIHTMYHEIRHQQQQQHSDNYNFDDLSYYYGVCEIINKYDEYDYKTNYRCYEIEKDANYYAWEDIEKLIKTYMSKQQLERTMKNILYQKLKEELEQIIGVRKTKDNQKNLSSLLLVKSLDEKIKLEPSLITNKYKQFLKFYNTDGTPKRMIELLKIPIIFDYRNFYFNQVNYRYNSYMFKLTQKDIKLSSKKELQVIINNIKILVAIAEEKMNKICDRVNKINTTDTEIAGNIKNYYNFSMYLSNILNEIVILYPELIKELSIKNAIDIINNNIKMINNNKLVGKTIGYNKKISKVRKK